MTGSTFPTSWNVPCPGYAPVDVTPPELRGDVVPEWAVPGTDPTVIDWPARQAEALVPFDVVDGYPLNPNGRTGRTGRDLRTWGENQAADPIVVAESPTGPLVLLIRREDCGQWAIPGGHVDPGETAPAALVRELREETGVDLTDVEPVILARTYVDDPRATDHAWITTTAALYRLPASVEATAGDDATEARWFPFASLTQLHDALVDGAA